MARFVRSILVGVLSALLSASPVLASAPRPAAVPDPALLAAQEFGPHVMSFRLVEGRGPFGLTRWIQASGSISLLTGQRFQEFARSVNVRGLTVALDSDGGNGIGGFDLGRALRAAGVNTTIGRTVVRREPDGEVATLVTHNALCFSACAYAFLGGVERRIAATAMYGVHRASYPHFNGTPQTAFDVAQETSAEVVDYLHELGIDTRLFVLAATQPADGMRILTRAEHERLRIAAFPSAETEARSIGWSPGIRLLYRRDTRVHDPSMQVDQETYVACYRDRYAVEVRLILVGTTEGASIKTDAVQIELGTQEQRRPAHVAASVTQPSTGVAIPFEVSREVLLEAAERGRFLIHLTGSTLNKILDVSAGFAELLPGLLASCDADQRRFSARP